MYYNYSTNMGVEGKLFLFFTHMQVNDVNTTLSDLDWVTECTKVEENSFDFVLILRWRHNQSNDDVLSLFRAKTREQVDEQVAIVLARARLVSLVWAYLKCIKIWQSVKKRSSTYRAISAQEFFSHLFGLFSGKLLQNVESLFYTLRPLGVLLRKKMK